MTKKIFSAVALCLATLMGIAQKPVQITGVLNFHKFTVQPVKLFKVSDGRCVQIAITTPTPDGAFGFLFYPVYEGIYVIGTGNEMSPNYNHEFYFKGGDHLSVEFTDWDYKLTGSGNSRENTELYAWHQLTDPIYQKAINFMAMNSTYVDFFPQLESIAASVKTWLNGKKTGNARFDAAMPRIMQMDMTMIATNFLNTPRSAQPALGQYSAYYHTLNLQELSRTTDLIYYYPWGVRTMTSLVQVNYNQSGKGLGPNFDYVKEFTSLVANDTLKGEIALDYAASIKDYGKYKNLMAQYGQYILTDDQKKREVDIAAPLATLKPGDDGYNFNYADKNGRMVSLSSMRGKVVLVDLWATWCGPCKAELPYLKQLEIAMEGKDIKFVGISVDQPKDKQKWMTFIDTAQLKGTQLFAGGWEKEGGIMKYYNVSGIPRFMIFDRKGRIVTVDAPRPSEAGLKRLLEKTLGE